MELQNFKANGTAHLNQEGTKYKRKDKRILSYYVVDNEPLIIEFKIKKNTVFDMDMVEASFDLLHNPLFKMIKRQPWMMPTPFILNDAVVVKQKIKSTTKTIALPFTTTINSVKKDSVQIATDTLKPINIINETN